MTKVELVSAVAAEAGVSKRVVEDVLNAFTFTVTNALASGESVLMDSFGIFEPKIRKERWGRDINKNTMLRIPEKTIPHFKPGSRLMEAVSKGGKEK